MVNFALWEFWGGVKLPFLVDDCVHGTSVLDVTGFHVTLFLLQCRNAFFYSPLVVDPCPGHHTLTCSRNDDAWW